MKIIAIVALICLSASAMKLAGVNDMAHDAEDFLENFYQYAFDIQMDLSTCEADASNTIQVVHETMDLITDHTDITQYIAAAQHLIANKEMFINTYEDCKTMGPSFVAGGLKLIPLTKEGQATHAMKMAALHHPISFALNLAKAKSAMTNGEYAKLGMYAGKDVHFLLDECTIGEEPNSISDLEEFTDAFYLAAFEIPLHLESCTQNAETSIEVIKKSLALIKDHSNPIEVVMSIMYITKHYKDLTTAFSHCYHAAPDLVKGALRLTVFTSLDNIKKASTGAFIHHPIGFASNLKKGQSALSAGRYEEAGRLLGTDAHWLLDEVESFESIFG